MAVMARAEALGGADAAAALAALRARGVHLCAHAPGEGARRALVDDVDPDADVLLVVMLSRELLEGARDLVTAAMARRGTHRVIIALLAPDLGEAAARLAPETVPQPLWELDSQAAALEARLAAREPTTYMRSSAWLSLLAGAAPSRPALENAAAGFAPGSRDWLVRGVDAWAAATPPKRVAVVLGAPGSGKTALAGELCARGGRLLLSDATLAARDKIWPGADRRQSSLPKRAKAALRNSLGRRSKKAQRPARIGAAHIVEPSRLASWADPAAVVRSVANQLAAQVPGLVARLEVLPWDARDARDAHEAVVRTLVGPLAGLTAPRMLVVLDGLDHCPEPQRSELAQALFEPWAAGKLPEWLGLVVLARTLPKELKRADVLHIGGSRAAQDSLELARARLSDRVPSTKLQPAAAAVAERSKGSLLFIHLATPAVGDAETDAEDLAALLARRLDRLEEEGGAGLGASCTAQLLGALLAARDPVPLTVLEDLLDDLPVADTKAGTGDQVAAAQDRESELKQGAADVNIADALGDVSTLVTTTLGSLARGLWWSTASGEAEAGTEAKDDAAAGLDPEPEPATAAPSRGLARALELASGFVDVRDGAAFIASAAAREALRTRVSPAHERLGVWGASHQDHPFAAHAAYHLSEAGLIEPVEALLIGFSWARNALLHGVAASTIAHDAHAARGQAAKVADVLASLPASLEADQLASQLCARLPRDHPTVELLATAMPRPWLRPLRPSLRRPANPLLREVQAPSRALVASAGGAVVVGSDDIEIWDREGRRKRAVEHAGGKVLSLAAAGDVAVTGSRDKIVRVFSLASGKLLRELRGHQWSVSGVAIAAGTADDWPVVSGSDDRTVRVWSLASGEELHALHGHSGLVSCVAVAGDKLISGSADLSVKVWSLRSGDLVHDLEGHTQPVTCVAMRGARALSGSQDRTARLWDVDSGRELCELCPGGGTVWCVAMGDDHLVAGAADGSVCVWDGDGDGLVRLAAHGAAVRSACLVDGARLVSAAEDCSVRFWSLAALRPADAAATPHAAAVTCVAVSEVAAVSGDSAGGICVWSTDSGELVGELAGHDAGVVCLSARGPLAASGARDHSVRIWSLDSCSLLHELHAHKARVVKLWFPPPGGRRRALRKPLQHKSKWQLVSEDRRGRVCHWQPWSGELLRMGGASTEEVLGPGDEPPLQVLHGHEVRVVGAAGFTLDAPVAASSSFEDVHVVACERNVHILRTTARP